MNGDPHMPRSSTRPPLPPSALNGYAWQRLRLVILERDNWTCQVPIPGRPNQRCGKYARTVDHILPRSQGGPTIPTNLRAACVRCNSRKGAREDSRPQGPTPHLRDW